MSLDPNRGDANSSQERAERKLARGILEGIVREAIREEIRVMDKEKLKIILKHFSTNAFTVEEIAEQVDLPAEIIGGIKEEYDL
ncbi:MAG: hypothetical protein AAGN35_11960 [Bacteroidota bacterium]